jgi:hypothetical protein
MKTEYFIFLAFAACAVTCLALQNIEGFTASAFIADIVGLGIVVDREIINPKKQF